MFNKYVFAVFVIAVLSGCDNGQVARDMRRDSNLAMVQAVLSEIKSGQDRLLSAQLESNKLQTAQLAATMQNTQALLGRSGKPSIDAQPQTEKDGR